MACLRATLRDLRMFHVVLLFEQQLCRSKCHAEDSFLDVTLCLSIQVEDYV